MRPKSNSCTQKYEKSKRQSSSHMNHETQSQVGASKMRSRPSGRDRRFVAYDDQRPRAVQHFSRDSKPGHVSTLSGTVVHGCCGKRVLCARDHVRHVPGKAPTPSLLNASHAFLLCPSLDSSSSQGASQGAPRNDDRNSSSVFVALDLSQRCASFTASLGFAASLSSFRYRTVRKIMKSRQSLPAVP